MEKKTLTKYMSIGFVTENDGEVGVQITPTLNYMEAMQLYTTLGLHILNAYYKAGIAPLNEKDNKDKRTTKEKAAAEIGIKESMYDTFNIAASNVLSMFYPDKEMRPDLTNEAILKMEDKLIEERFNKMNPKERDKALANIRKAKLQAQARGRFSKDTNESTDSK